MRRRIAVGRDGRFAKAATAVGRLRRFGKRLGCDSGWRRSRATAGLPSRTGACSGTTAHGEAVRLVVDGSSLALGGTGRLRAARRAGRLVRRLVRPRAYPGRPWTT